MSDLSPSSVTSECEKARGTVDGRKVAVIDTPGMYDTNYKEAEVIRKLKECISLSAPGPRVPDCYQFDPIHNGRMGNC